MSTKVWRLLHGNELLAILTEDGNSLVEGLDPNLCEEGSFILEDAMKELWPLFQRELELIESDSESEEWIDIWDQLRAPGLFIESESGDKRIEILTIHFKQSRAWWMPLYSSPNSQC